MYSHQPADVTPLTNVTNSLYLGGLYMDRDDSCYVPFPSLATRVQESGQIRSFGPNFQDRRPWLNRTGPILADRTDFPVLARPDWTSVRSLILTGPDRIAVLTG